MGRIRAFGLSLCSADLVISLISVVHFQLGIVVFTFLCTADHHNTCLQVGAGITLAQKSMPNPCS